MQFILRKPYLRLLAALVVCFTPVLTIVHAQDVISTPDASAFNPQGEVEFVGKLTAIGSGTMTIGGQAFSIRGAEIKAGVALNTIVKVHASRGANNTWIAREVELAGPRDIPGSDDQQPGNAANPAGEFEIRGRLTEIGEGFVVVLDQTIRMEGTEVKDVLAVGDLVKVHVSIVNNEWTAREIELANHVDDNLQNHDRSDDHGRDAAGHDINDDRGNDAAGHDANDDQGGQNDDSHHDDNSGHGSNSGSDDGNSDHDGDSGHE